MRKNFWMLFIPLLAIAFVMVDNPDSINRTDVKAAQKLLHLTLEDQYIDTLLSYLESNRKGYDTMRTFHLDFEIAPALTFDPFPLDFTFSTPNPVHDWQPERIDLPQTDEAIAFLDLRQQAFLLQTGKLTSYQLTKIYLERIKKYDPQLLAFVTVTEDLALSQAEKADAEIRSGKYRGILHGIPYGIKDLAAVPGYPTTWGSAPYKDQYFDYTATVVERLEAAGAVLLGKLVSGSLARGDVWFGGKTKNPWDLSQGATGSSAGSGSAAAAALVSFAIGTETLGSIISPATRCGASGLRPTFGAVSRSGFMTLSWSMDKVGPICRSALDCAVVFDYIRGSDKKDRSAKDVGFESPMAIAFNKMKIGYFHQLFDADTSAHRTNNLRTLEELKALGIQMEPVEIPQNFPFAVFDIILRAESGAFFDELLLNKQDGILEEQDKGSRANSLRQSRFIPAVEYLQANRHRARLIERMHELMKGYDVVVSPTFAGRQMLITNLTGHPAMSLPNGWDSKGRPTSITLIGNYFDEGKILALAHAYQQASGYHGKVPIPLQVINMQ
jgi:Asp-tRNA(Asn)/Glu-tRNA(Gln) amidotransferase A subunit family amidase